MTPSIGLAMIVRNESGVVDRCLASVIPLIDTWTIIDTGSTDDTIARIHTSLDGVPGTLHERPWIDFGHNRSELMALASGTADYLLLVDADMTVVQLGDLGPLGGDAYLLRHLGDLDYSIPRLVRGDLPWRYEGSTHEYLTADVPHRREPYAALTIDHHADGGARGDKFERDRRLLEAALVDTPDDSRTLFYLAQTYRDLGEIDLAIDTYRRRVDVGGWDEETFYAKYQIGLLLTSTDWDRAVVELLEAWDFRPSRAEPLLELARGHRNRGRHHLAELYARRGLEIEVPDDLLFVHREGYDWALRFEHAIALYWTGDLAAARAANQRLLADGVPDHVAPWVRHNLAWCNQSLAETTPPEIHDPLPLLADLTSAAPGGTEDEREVHVEVERPVEITPVMIDVPPGWSSFNPSIASGPRGLQMIVRTSNYVLDDNGYYFVDDRSGDDTQNGLIRTRNQLVHLDDELAVTDQVALTEIPPGAPTYATRVRGCEDCRLVRVGDRWYATATVRDRNDEEWCEIALIELPDTEEGPVRPLRVLSTTAAGRHEKNWMPFTLAGQLHLLIHCDPVVVARCDVDTGELTEVSSGPGPAEASSFRGSSQGLPDGDGWIFVVHEVTSLPGTSSRRYSHRFIRLDAGLAIRAVSDRFSFTGAPIEFCAGIAEDGDDVLLSFGVGDNSAHVARVARRHVHDLLVAT